MRKMYAEGSGMKERNEKFGESLKQKREEIGYSVRGLAEILGVSYSSLSNWENGKLTPGIENVMKLEKYLNADFFQYYRGQDSGEVEGENG